MLLAPTDSDPLDESDEADAILLNAPIYLADAAADGRGTGKQLQRVRKSLLHAILSDIIEKFECYTGLISKYYEFCT